MACGTGIISIELAKRGYHVWAGDVSREALEYLRLQNPAINREICDFNKGFPFQDNFFDAATSVWANRYITSDGLSVFLREMHRVLKPGGVLIWPIFPADTVLWKVRSGVGQITSASGLIEVIKGEGFSEAIQLNDLFYKNLFSFKLPPQTVPIYIVARK